MKTLKTALLAMLLWLPGMAQQPLPQAPEPTDMQLTISMKKRQPSGAIMVNLEYKNTSTKDIRLLDEFRNNDSMINTKINITRLGPPLPREIRPDGSARLNLFRPPVTLGGSIDPGPGGFRYVTIKPGRTFKFAFNMSKSFGKYVVPAGEYELYMTYSNYYGENCIIGKGYTSNTVTFTVVK